MRAVAPNIFRSAIEVEGSDGTIFEIQEEPNLVIDIAPGERASDPDVFQLADGRWGMLITWLEGTAFFTSDTLHGEYLPAEHLGSPPYLADPFYGLGVSHFIAGRRRLLDLCQHTARHSQEPKSSCFKLNGLYTQILRTH